MMEIRSDVIATLYSEGAAIAFMIGLLVLSVHLRERFRVESRMFFGLCLNVIIMSVFGALAAILRYREFAGVKILSKLSYTGSELALLFLLVQWFVFVNYIIYRSKDHLRRNAGKLLIPLGVMGLVFIVNIFTDILFGIDENNMIEHRLGSIIITIIEFLYVLSTVILLTRYRRTSKSPVFIRIRPFIIPFTIGAVVSTFTGYAAHSMGIAVGLVLLHFSMINGYCYIDEETGCYNKAYLKYLDSYTKKNNFEGGTMILFKTANNYKGLADIILEAKPVDSDVVAMGNGELLFLSDTQRKSSIHMFIELIKDEAKEKGIEVTTSFGVRKLDETSEDFFNRVVAK